MSLGLAKLIFELEGKSFVTNMVRALVGMVIEIGQGRLQASALDTLLAVEPYLDPPAVLCSAPPDGLVLMWIKY